MKKRPLGVKILGWWLALLCAATSFGVVLITFGAKELLGSDWKKAVGAGVAGSFFSLVMSVGLLGLKSWARLVMLFLASLSVFTVGVGLFVSKHSSKSVAGMLSQLLIDAVIIWYFLRPSVKAQFQKQP